MALHGGDEHPLGQRKVLLRNAPGDDARPLDEVHDLLDLPGGVAPGAARHRRSGVQALHDRRAPLAVIRDHERRPQLRAIRIGGGDLHGAAQEPVAPAPCAGRHARNLERDRAVPGKRGDPAHGPRESQPRAIAPPHGLAESQALQHTPRDVRHQLLKGGIIGREVHPDELTPAGGVLAHHQVRHLHALSAGESHGRLRWGAIVPEGRPHRRPADGTRLSPLPRSHALAGDRDTAGSHPRAGRPRGIQVQVGEGAGQQAGRLRDGLPAGA